MNSKSIMPLYYLLRKQFKSQLELHFKHWNNSRGNLRKRKLKYILLSLKIKLKYKVGISNNLWMPLSSHLYFHRWKPWCRSFMMAQKGLPFYSSMKWGISRHWNERAMIGHFQKVGLVGKLAPGCLGCCQTWESLIRDLLTNQDRCLLDD